MQAQHEKSHAFMTAGREIFAIDLRSLASFRIAIGALLLIDHVQRLGFLRLLFTDQGYLPRQGILEIFGPSIRWTSLHLHTGRSVELQAIMLCVGMIAALAYMLGYKTRVATVVSWLLFISLNRRIPSSCYGFDDIMRLMLFWSFFLPTAAVWSIDSRNQQAPHQGKVCSAGTVAILLQVCSIYWFTAVWKCQHPDWYGGAALRHALQMEDVGRPLASWVADLSWLTVPATYATLVGELLIPCVALSPWRNTMSRIIAIAFMWGLHLGIWILLSIGLLPPICLAYWLLFVPTEAWNALGARFGQQPVGEDKWFRSHHFAESGPAVKILIGVLLVQITTYNVLDLPQARQAGIPFPRAFQRLTQLMRIDQSWSLYSSPRGPDGWLAMPAHLADGSTFDTWLNGPVVSDSKPASIPSTFRYYRIKMLLRASLASRDLAVWNWVARRVALDWNAQHAPSRKIMRQQVVYFYEEEHGGPIQTFPMADYSPQ